VMMDTLKTQSRKIEFFQLVEESKALNESILDKLHLLQQHFVKQRLSEENTLHYTHGQKWTNRAAPYAQNGEFQAQTSEWATPFKDLVQGDLSLIPRFLQQMSSELQAKFMSMLYSTLGKACDEAGNTVDAKKAGSVPAAFMEMFQKIEFGVDREGNVTLPEIHVGADPAKLIAELEAQPPHYHAEMERIKAEKISAAHARERLRRSRFRKEC
jgi:hypothetical protein